MKRRYCLAFATMLAAVILTLLLLASTALAAQPGPEAGPPWYLRGDFNGWGTWLMYDDGSNGDLVAGDNIYSYAAIIGTAGRYEFKVDDGSWTDPHPPSNAWTLTTVPSQTVLFTFDTNSYMDGWQPSTNIVNVQDGVTSWTAVGDWQGWDNANVTTTMEHLGGGMYAYITRIPTTGTHQYKAVRTGSWDAVGPDGGEGGRSINTTNIDFDTTVDDQLVRFLLDAVTGRIQVQFPSEGVIINELDADTAGTERDEFIELFDGGVGNTPLDGLVVVMFNGSDDQSYTPVFDLDGYSTDANGYFVIGGENVPGADITTTQTYWLQNGADAAALFVGDSVEFPNDTPVTTTNLIDAIVYGTDDADDAGLLPLLNPGQPQVNEGSWPDRESESNQRCLNGMGGARNTMNYYQAAPSPGAANACPELIINELDADTEGTEVDEFIELYDGGVGNAPLSGLVVVLFNGSDDQSYTPVFDLDGYWTDADGYFVIGGSNVPGADITTTQTYWLQNGADAAALMIGDGADFPNDTPVTTTNVIDAIVYGTADGDDPGLLPLLNPGQPQVNEGAYPGSQSVSNQRCPNGSGGQRNTYTYFQTDPTPGADNNCPEFIINELDADTAGTESEEFLELYDGGFGNVALDGLVVVLFNGSDDQSYLPAFDLDGYSTDANGYFVIGGSNVPGADITTTQTYWLQNGADAATLFVGDATDFPNDTPVTTTNLIDAIVYGTADADDAGLLPLLNAGQPQVDEGGWPDSESQSSQRCPDGSGGQRNTDTYIQGDPSPGATNNCPSADTDVGVVKQGPDVGVIGSNLVYTITVNNFGVVSATNVVLTDVMPISVTYLSDDSGYACPACLVGSAGPLTWTVGTVPSSTVQTFFLTVTVDAGLSAGTIVTNEIQVGGDLPNDELPNNVDQWETEVYPMVSIYDIQFVPDPANDDASPYLLDYVWVEGVVIADSYAFGSNTRYYIEDPAGGPWSGLYIYNGGTHPGVDEGDMVRLFGMVDEYNGVTQLSIRTGGLQELLSIGNPLPAPEIIATGVYTPDGAATAEAYESVLIEFQGATVTDDDLGYGEWAFDDGSGDAHADDWSNYLTYEPVNGDQYVYIRGIGNYSYGDYKLVPRYDADIFLWADSIAMTKVAPSLVDPGERFTYTIVITNPLTTVLNDLVITDVLPASDAELAAILDGGVLIGNVVSWTHTSLAVLDSVSFRFVMTASGSVGSIIANIDYAVSAGNWTTPTLGSPRLTTIGSYTPIYAIQGTGLESPFDGQTVKTVGVVVGFFEGNMPYTGVYDGFYIQDATGDGDPATSDGIFVNHGTDSVAVIVGDLVTVTGVVQEFNEYGDPCPACETQIVMSDLVIGPNVGAPAPVELVPDGGMLSLEAHEGMLVTVTITSPVVGPTNYGTFMVIRGDEGVDRVMRSSPQDGKAFGARNWLRYGSGGPNLIVGSVITDGLEGPLAYSYGNYLVSLQNLAALDYYSAPPPAVVPSWPEAAADEFSVATYNTYNYDDGDPSAKLTKVVSTVVEMGAPTFVALQEIAVDEVITDVIDALALQGYSYDYAFSHPDVGGHGVAVIWRTDRLSGVTWSTQYQDCSPYGSSSSTYDPLWATCQAAGEYPLFSRRPVVVTGTLSHMGSDAQVVVVGNHFKAKGSGTPADLRRLGQAQLVAGLVDDLVANGMDQVLVMGDLNDFEDSAPLQALYASGNLTNTWFTLPPEAWYSYIYRGTSQILDHVLASSALLAQMGGVSPMHYNADYPHYPYSSNGDVIWRSSDHDTVAATFSLPNADLSILKTVETAGPDVYLGDPITYTVVVANAGGADAVGVHVTDTLPAGLVGSDLDWTGTVPAGDQVAFTIPATVETDPAYYGQTIVNTAYYDHDSGSGSDDVSFDIVMPDIAITSPEDGASLVALNGISVTVPITVATPYFQIPADGHWYLYVDGALVGDPVMDYSTSTDLMTGTHVISAELRGPSGELIGPTDAVTVTVYATGISFVSPLEGQVFTATNNVSLTIPIEVETQNFEIPADGHWHLYLDGSFVGMVYTYTTTLDLDLGTHVLRAELVDSSHQPLGPVDMVTVEVRAYLGHQLYMPLVFRQ